VLDYRAREREKKLIEQLPEALDQMARGLKVGHPVNTTIANVAATMPDPIGTEFGLVADQIAYGDDLVDAVAEMADRLGNEDVHYFTVALGIQHGTGGNLGRILSTLATVIRDRDMMRRRIKAISSEGRMTMYCMTALNPLLFIAMQIINPNFFGDVINDPLFKWSMGFVVVMTVLNFLALKRQTNFRI
jgi:tight adherence protein B